jgi:hypothetical protein
MKSNNKKEYLTIGFKILVLFLLIIVSTSELWAQSNGNGLANKAVNGGIGLGAAIAVVASWSRNQSILWAILHGILSWIYVIHFAITRTENRY